MPDELITISPRTRFRAAMLLAIVADALQIIAFPLFLEGAYSPLDDVLDFAVAAVLVNLLGWHWEFLPSFAAKLVPGADLVPFWTLAPPVRTVRCIHLQQNVDDAKRVLNDWIIRAANSVANQFEKTSVHDLLGMKFIAAASLTAIEHSTVSVAYGARLPRR